MFKDGENARSIISISSSIPSTAISTMHNVTETLRSIVDAVNQHAHIIIPDSLKESFDTTCDYLRNYRTPSPTPGNSIDVLPMTFCSVDSNISPSSSGIPTVDDLNVQHHVKLNRQTMLETLYTYKPGALIEYPRTSATGWVGHLVSMDLASPWISPVRNFAYSQGAPDGSSGSKTLKCRILVNESGEEVPCKEIHSTCMFTSSLMLSLN